MGVAPTVMPEPGHARLATTLPDGAGARRAPAAAARAAAARLGPSGAGRGAGAERVPGSGARRPPALGALPRPAPAGVAPGRGTYKAVPCAVQVDVERCFAPLLRWVLGWWQGRELALAVDATAHREDVVALVVSVLHRGSAVPVARAVLPGDAPGAWGGPILRLLRLLRPAVPAGWTVLVLADRGLWSPRLWKRVRDLGWHPLLRLQRRDPITPHRGPRPGAAPGPAGGGGAPAGGSAGPSRRGLGRPRSARPAEGPGPDGHPGRGLDGGAGGALGRGHRPGAGSRRGELVRAAGLGRARLPGPQGCRLAVAALAPDRSRPGRAALAGAGGGQPVGAGARHPRRGRARARPAAGPAARPSRTAGRRPPAPDQPVPARAPVAAPPARARSTVASVVARSPAPGPAPPPRGGHQPPPRGP